MLWFLQMLLSWLGLILFVLLSVAFFTVMERQVFSSVQRRLGPNVIGFYGILQAIADGVKLILKELVIPRSADSLIFIVAPVASFALALSIWTVIPFNYGFVMSDFEYGILYIFTVSSLSVHSIIMAGWSSNSKYAFLGALRSAAQMISYEVSLGITVLAVILITGSLNLTEIVLNQKHLWNAIPLFPMFVVFVICALAETNRHPFDLPEAESELVSGYNVEYSGIGFTLFFLAEYSNILAMCTLIVLFFLGGWNAFFEPLTFFLIFNWTIAPGSFSIVLKIFLIMFFFVIIRSTIPRYRYDQLMRLGWKVFLPISLAFFIIFSATIILFDWTLLNNSL